MGWQGKCGRRGLERRRCCRASGDGDGALCAPRGGRPGRASHRTGGGRETVEFHSIPLGLEEGQGTGCSLPASGLQGKVGGGVAGEQREEESSALERSLRKGSLVCSGRRSGELSGAVSYSGTALGARSSCSNLVCAPEKHSEVYLVLVRIT